MLTIFLLIKHLLIINVSKHRKTLRNRWQCPLSQREHDLDHSRLLSLEELPPPLEESQMASLATLGERMANARREGASVLVLMGAHVIRAGVNSHLVCVHCVNS